VTNKELIAKARRRWDWSYDENTINDMIDERGLLADALESAEAEIERLRAAITNEREVCAKIAEGEPLPESPERYTHWPDIPGWNGNSANDGERVHFARKIAAAIRDRAALTSPAVSTPPEDR
jgi:hypothetical protein